MDMDKLMVEVAANHGCTPEEMGAEHLWFLMQEEMNFIERVNEAEFPHDLTNQGVEMLESIAPW